MSLAAARVRGRGELVRLVPVQSRLMLTRVEGGVQFFVRSPLVYFDHCALRCISSDPARRDHLRETFRTRGTLMFSVLNMLEMAQNRGDSYESIRLMLDDLDRYWLPSDLDSETVSQRERQGVRPPAVFLVPVEMLSGIIQALPLGTYSLGAALAKPHDAEFRSRAPELLQRSASLLAEFQRQRQLRQRGENLVPLKDPKFSVSWIQTSLLRLLIRDGKEVDGNDMNDVMHASVSLRYADVVVLDKAWADIAGRLKLPDTRIFRCTKAGLADALSSIRTIDISNCKVTAPP